MAEAVTVTVVDADHEPIRPKASYVALFIFLPETHEWVIVQRAESGRWAPVTETVEAEDMPADEQHPKRSVIDSVARRSLAEELGFRHEGHFWVSGKALDVKSGERQRHFKVVFTCLTLEQFAALRCDGKELTGVQRITQTEVQAKLALQHDFPLTDILQSPAVWNLVYAWGRLLSEFGDELLHKLPDDSRYSGEDITAILANLSLAV